MPTKNKLEFYMYILRYICTYLERLGSFIAFEIAFCYK